MRDLIYALGIAAGLYVFVLWAYVVVVCAREAFAPEPAPQPRAPRMPRCDRALAGFYGGA